MFSLKEIETQQVAKKQMVAEIKAIEGYAIKNTRVREVLDEETFVDGLERIITRDYYPELNSILEYKKLKDEQSKAMVTISDLLSAKTQEEVVKRSTFERDTEKMNISQYVTKYTSEDNNALDQMMERDREKYIQKHAWMFQPHLKALTANQTLQIESDNKLRNMIEGNQSGHLQFSASDPMSKFIFNSLNPAIESYSEPFSHTQKQIIKENTRLTDFVRPQYKPKVATGSAEELLGKRDFFRLSTPSLLGLKEDKKETGGSPFDLKKIMGNESDDELEGEIASEHKSKGFKPLRFPSPSPSQLGSPIMTWGVIECEPIKLGGYTQREAVSSFMTKYQENPREKLAHELSSKLLERSKLKNRRKEEQLQRLLTPYSNRLGSSKHSTLISSISSRLQSNQRGSTVRQSTINTPQARPSLK